LQLERLRHDELHRGRVGGEILALMLGGAGDEHEKLAERRLGVHIDFDFDFALTLRNRRQLERGLIRRQAARRVQGDRVLETGIALGAYDEIQRRSRYALAVEAGA